MGSEATKLLEALATAKSEWRTTKSLAVQCGIPVPLAREVLQKLEARRRPVAASGEELEYHRLVNRGLSRRGKWRGFRLGASRQAR